MQGGFSREHGAVFNLVLRTGDVALAFIAGWIVYVLYLGDSHSWTPLYSYAFIIVGLLVVLIFSYFSLYQVWRGISFIDEMRKMITAWSLVFVVFALFTFVSKTGPGYSRVWLGLWFFTGLVMLLAFRGALRLALKALRQRGINLRHIVIAGGDELGQQVANRLIDASWSGFRVAGFFCDKPKHTSLTTQTIPYLGKLEDLAHYVESSRIDQVWIALPLSQGEALEYLLHELRHTIVDIRYVPDIFGIRLINHSVIDVAGVPVVNISVSPMDGINRWLKAFEDRLLSLLILIVIAPLLLLIALGVKLSSPGPAIYRQTRVGWNGRPFTILKFRTMPISVESTGIEWGGAKAKVNTKFGALLRKTSLDELPQFINVLQGDMSIVGPRPERPVFVDQFKDIIPEYMKKHMVKAGITGWAQINGWRGDTDLKRRIECDLYYIENWSVWLDLKIIFMTLFKGFEQSKK